MVCYWDTQCNECVGEINRSHCCWPLKPEALTAVCEHSVLMKCKKGEKTLKDNHNKFLNQQHKQHLKCLILFFIKGLDCEPFLSQFGEMGSQRMSLTGPIIYYIHIIMSTVRAPYIETQLQLQLIDTTLCEYIETEGFKQMKVCVFSKHWYRSCDSKLDRRVKTFTVVFQLTMKFILTPYLILDYGLQQDLCFYYINIKTLQLLYSTPYREGKNILSTNLIIILTTAAQTN